MIDSSDKKLRREREYVLVEEILSGGYIQVASAINICSEQLKKIYIKKDFVALKEYREDIIQSDEVDHNVIRIINKSPGARYLYFGNIHDSVIANISYNKYPPIMVFDIDMSQCVSTKLSSDIGDRKSHVFWTFVNWHMDGELLNTINVSDENIFILEYGFRLKDKIYVDFIVDMFPKFNKRHKSLNKSIKEKGQFNFSVICDDIILR